MIFSINVLDWQQSNLDSGLPVSGRVWKHCNNMLALMQMHHVAGTFFITRRIANKYPVLLHKLVASGHEIGCYLDTAYDPGSFAQFAASSIHNLEDISGKKVIGVRSASLSLQDTSFSHYCRILHKLGIRYDSSLRGMTEPSAHLDVNPTLDAFKAYNLKSYPVSALLPQQLFNSPLNRFGGSLFRIMPYSFTHHFARSLDKESSVFEVPVYELGDNELEELETEHHVDLIQRRDFWGRSRVSVKLSKLFRDHPLQSFKECYYEAGK